MTRCVQYISLSSIKQILRDPAHGVARAYVNSPRTTFGELSCHHFTASEDKRQDAARGLTLGRPGRWDSCLCRQDPDSVDLC